jgi:tetratricopeptide (TPR) repeat protein
MYNYDKLEKIYYARKRKKRFIYFSILFVLIIIAYFLYNINIKIHKQHQKHTMNTQSEINSSKKSINITEHKNIVKSKIDTTKKVEKNIPKLEANIKKETNKTKKLNLTPVVPDLSLIHIKVSDKKGDAIKSYTVTNTKKSLKMQKPKIVIKVSETTNSLKDLLNNYKVFPRYETAIKIANIYFSQKKYDKCIEWAKKANNINPEDAESWLLYAKSLVKSGKPNEAKKLLDSYIEIYGENQKIRTYLRSIK